VRPRIVVLGAGYAGVHAARSAAKAGGDVTLVDPDGHHDLLPRLAQVAAGSAPIGDAWADAERLLDDVTVHRSAATGVDPSARVVETEAGPVAYDALVVTTGAGAVQPGDDGMVLRTAGDALRIRAALADARRLVVVGGGATGVQLAGAARDAHPDLDVHLVELESRLLPAFSRPLSRHAARVLRRRGVELHLAADAEVCDGGVTVDGERLEGVVVWAAGFSADGTTLLPDAPNYEGRLIVDRQLRVRGLDRVLAAGDVARHRDVIGRPLEMSAQIAVQAGKAAGRNAVAVARAERPSAAHLVDLGWVIDLGGGAGVAQVGPVRIAAPIVDRVVPVLHGAVDARHLLQAGGLDALLSFGPGQHEPTPAEVRRAERPELRSVG
jgi:NADH dehydrogenase